MTARRRQRPAVAVAVVAAERWTSRRVRRPVSQLGAGAADAGRTEPTERAAVGGGPSVASAPERRAVGPGRTGL